MHAIGILPRRAVMRVLGRHHDGRVRGAQYSLPGNHAVHQFQFFRRNARRHLVRLGGVEHQPAGGVARARDEFEDYRCLDGHVIRAGSDEHRNVHVPACAAARRAPWSAHGSGQRHSS